MPVPYGAVGTNYIEAEITARPKDSCAKLKNGIRDIQVPLPEKRTDAGESASKPEMDGDTDSSS